MAEIIENEERVFKHFLELPEKARMVVIDEMKPDDRCRMTRCSKQCDKEAKASKNYIFELRLSYSYKYFKSIGVVYGKHSFISRERDGYSVTYSESSSGKKSKHYMSLRFRTMWVVELDDSADILQCVIEEFKNVLKCYQKNVKVLSLDGSETRDESEILKSVNSGIHSLESLEYLRVTGFFDIQQILSKVHRPLKELSVIGGENCAILKNCEQLYQVQQLLSCWELDLNYQQFSRLLAKGVTMSVKSLTERDVFKFIRSWQDGSIGMELRTCCWDLRGSNFDKKKLLRLLRVENNPNLNRYIEIKHFENCGKRALLNEQRGILYFHA